MSCSAAPQLERAKLPRVPNLTGSNRLDLPVEPLRLAELGLENTIRQGECWGRDSRMLEGRLSVICHSLRSASLRRSKS